MLRWQLDTTPETVADFELAAEARYWDGCQLITQNHLLGGIYLLGYTAEMILKHASFRIDRGRPGDPAGGFFGPTRAWMQAHYPLIEPVCRCPVSSIGSWCAACGGCIRFGRWTCAIAIGSLERARRREYMMM